ncbi:YslB family protein [Calidifontibacillus erzurumensis]|uniref:YslB family protein n=1 Tax=Calidifontibacillus erzurumensis TaxID=2741433 RepID=A0A8J8GE89_9BACI|nr:YslB family protein [Calidifontibacillus erzurumensis]NSL51551.1 YslB family protein [Calidifontibacillus erzurumensis]
MFTKKNQTERSQEEFHQLTVPAFGYELIRYTFLKDILGKDYQSILYWGGKNIARKYPLKSIEEVVHFFEKSGLGQISLMKENKNEMVFQLTSDLIANRFERNVDYSYQLEAGFLAEQLQNILEKEAEAMELQQKKTKSVLITVKWE